MDKSWCVHVKGPDDLIPAPSLELAEKASDLINAQFPDTASVIEWPYENDGHNDGLINFYEEFPSLQEKSS
jgi:hypothetical protein